jgi:3-deoxy-D-manno-octulosonic-acid transferase
MGQYHRNVREIVSDLEHAGALVQIGTAEDARRFVADVATASSDLIARGGGALAVWQRHRGAADKIVSRLQGLSR